MEESSGERRHEMVEARHGAGRLAHDRDIVLVTSKCRNVTIDPLQSKDLVEHTLRIKVILLKNNSKSVFHGFRL